MKRWFSSFAVLCLFSAPLLKAQVPGTPSGGPPPPPPATPPLRTGEKPPVPGPKQPVLIYLYADVADQVNLDITEDRLRRMLPMIERFQKAHPEAHVSATILFSGAVSQALYQRNAQTHIKDLILDYKKRGVIEVGYDGTDEPTYV